MFTQRPFTLIIVCLLSQAVDQICAASQNYPSQLQFGQMAVSAGAVRSGASSSRSLTPEETVLIAKGRMDIEKTLHEIATIEQPKRRSRLLAVFLSVLSEERLDLLEPITRSYETLEEAKSELNLYQHLTSYWMPRNAHAFLNAAARLPRESHDKLFEEIVIWLGRDATLEQAASLIPKIPESFRPAALLLIIEHHPKSERNDLFSWLRTQPALSDDAYAKLRWYAEASRDIELLRWLIGVTEPTRIRPVLLSLGIAAGTFGVARVDDELTGSHFTPAQREWISAGAVATVPYHQLEEFLTRALAAGDFEVQKHAIHAAIPRLFGKSRSSAMRRVRELPQDLRPAGIQSLVRCWQRSDLTTLESEWIGSLPEGADRDHTLLALAECMAATDRGGAINFAKRISDVSLREKVLGWLKQ